MKVPRVLSISIALFLFALFFSVVGNLSAQDSWGRLQGFEDADLSRWSSPDNSVNFSRDSTYVTQMQYNLRAEFMTGGVLEANLNGLWRMEEIIREKFSDEGGGGWKIYEAIFVDIYTSGGISLLLTFSDTTGGFYEEIVTLKKGLNHLQFKADRMLGLDFLSLSKVSFTSPQETIIYIDHLRTWEYQPELDRRGVMDIVYSDSVAGPHIVWQNPDAAGPFRALFVPRPQSGSVMVKLMRMFDLSTTTVSFEPSLGMHRWSFGDFYGTRALGYDHVNTKFSISYAQLTSELESDKTFEVIVLPPMRGWNNMPAEQREALKKRVLGGAGLVLIQPTVSGSGFEDFRDLSPLDGGVRIESYRPRESDQPENRPAGMSSGLWVKSVNTGYITRNIPLELIPTQDIPYLSYSSDGAEVLIVTESGQPILATGTYGKGRVVAFAWVDQGMFPTVENPEDDKNGLEYWDYIYALIGRSVRWAVGKETVAGIHRLDLREKVGKVELSAQIKGALDGDILRVELRDGEWNIISEQNLSISGDASTSISFADVGASGRVIAHAFHHRADGAIVDFGAAFKDFALRSKISSLDIESETINLGDQVGGKVRIEGKPSIVTVELADNRDRLLDIDTLNAVAGNEIEFKLSCAGATSRRAMVKAKIIDGNRPVEFTEKSIFVDHPSAWNDYEVMMYRFMGDVLPGEWKFLDNYMEELGVTAWAAVRPELVYRSNLGIQAETRIDSEESHDGAREKPYREQKRNYVETHDKKYLQRIHSQNDPAYLEAQKLEVQRKVNDFKQFSPLSYYVWEEPSYTHYGDAFDLSFDPFTLSAFRQWLKGEYGTLQALNDQWGTGFGKWEDVIPDDTYEAQERGNYSSWADHRLHSNITYASNYAYAREKVREVDPDGIVMMTGTQRTVPHNGYDYYLLDQAIDHTQPYGEPIRHRDFIRKGGKITGCTGYGVYGPKLLYELWSRLFYGHNAGSAIFWQFSTIDPDYRLCKSGKDMMEIFHELRHRGIARLLDIADYSPSEVVLLWSIPSINGTWIQDGRITVEDGAPSECFERWEKNYESWRWLLDDMGVPYRVMSWQQLDSDWLKTSGAKILVLANTIALSEKGAKAIEEFVLDGGVVIGDSQTALMDNHSKWLKRGRLDELFGIRGGRTVTIPVADGIIERNPSSWGLSVAEDRIKPFGGKKLDLGHSMPGAIENNSGKGRSFYLNTFMAGYGLLRQDGHGGDVRKALGKILDIIGYKPLFSIKTSTGRDITGAKITGYDLGSQGRIVGVLKDYRGEIHEDDIALNMPEKGHLYDIRRGKYLGYGEKFVDRIATGEVRLYASLPYQIMAIDLECSEKVRPGETVSLKIRLISSGEAKILSPHVIVTEVFSPDGEKAYHYSENLVAENGVAGKNFKTALNDSPGRWRIKAVDTATGIAAETYCTVY